jgi:hypothetical protein
MCILIPFEIVILGVIVWVSWAMYQGYYPITRKSRIYKNERPILFWSAALITIALAVCQFIAFLALGLSATLI